MNNKLKNILLIAAAAITVICIAIGCMMHSGIFYLNKILGWDCANGSDSVEMTQILEETVEEPFDSIDATIDFGNLYIEKGDSNFIEATATDAKLIPSIEVVDNKLCLKQSSPIIRTVGKFDTKCDIIITLKEEKLKKLDASLSLGNLEINEIDVQDACCHLDLGNISIADGNIDVLEVLNNLGNVEMAGTDFSEAVITCDLGDIDISLPFNIEECQKDISVELGEINMAGTTCGTKYKNDEGSKKLTIDSKLGDVFVQ